MPKQREKNSCWTTTIDDFGLWQGEECEKDATPLLGSVSVSKAHVLSKKINATSSRSVNQVGSQLQSRKADDFHESISSVNYTKAQESSVVSSCLPSTVQASIEPTRRPWEYSKQTVREPVVSIPYKLPLVLTATSENKSTESAAQSVDPLPPFIYRKPGTVREPLQKTIKAPFQPVEKENIRQQTVSRFEPTLQHSPSVRSQRQDPSSSSSTAPSRIFDNRSVSSRTIVSSSPYRNNQYNSNPPVKKGSYPTSNRRPQPARVTYRKSITNQSRLAFEPVPRQNRQSRPPSSPISEFQQRSNDRSSVQPSLSASMSYDSSSPHQALTWTPQVVKGHDSSEYLPSDYTRTSQNESTGRFPLYNNMHSSLRSAMEQAIDKDFLRSFQDSPVRGRIAADCQTSRSKGWASAAYSAEERRLRQYPQVFDQDPARILKQSKEKMAQFNNWNTRSSGAAITQRNLPSAPRLGAASKGRSSHLANLIASGAIREQQQQQQPNSTPKSNVRGPRQPPSEASDEYDCDFDYADLPEEDLARLEAWQQ